jgi:G3E family GTPase
VAIPVHIVAGFLGTGKTTALRSQLEARRGEHVAVIVNDFGEARFDEFLLASDEPFRILNIPGGCVCCTAPEGFVAALGAVLERRPDRIFIEPTGLARPQDLVDTLRRCPQRDALALGPVIVLVDPARLGQESGEERALLESLAEGADVLVANRTDLCGPDALARFDAWARERWPAPLAVHRTTRGRIPGELWEWPDGQGPRLAAAGLACESHGPGEAHPGPSTAAYRARSFRWGPEVVFERSRLRETLRRLASGEAGAPLVRAKGLFRTREGVLQLEVAGGAIHEHPSGRRRDSRVDVLFETRDEAPLSRAHVWVGVAILTDEERRAQSQQIEVVLPDGHTKVMDRAALTALPEPVPDVSALFPKRNGTAARMRVLWEAIAAPVSGSAIVCAADGFASEPIPVPALREGLLLHSEAGEPLSEKRGGPFRLLIPDDTAGVPASCANVKGVTRIVIRP